MQGMNRGYFYLTTLLSMFLCLSATGQETDEAPIKVSTELVTVNVAVTDASGLAVTGLSRDRFTLFDNKIPQDIHFFSDADTPVSISVVLDTSGSMSGQKLDQARSSLASFIKTTSGDDEFFLIDLGSRARLLLGGTRDADSVIDKFTYVEARGKTALFDAVGLGIEKVRQGSRAKKIVLIISDGEDNNSRLAFRDLKNQLRESDAVVYAIGIGGYASAVQRGPSGRETLKDLAEISGGRAYFPSGEVEMADAFDQISADIRHLYAIGFYPADATESKSHSITVKLANPGDRGRIFIRGGKTYKIAALSGR